MEGEIKAIPADHRFGVWSKDCSFDLFEFLHDFMETSQQIPVAISLLDDEHRVVFARLKDCNGTIEIMRSHGRIEHVSYSSIISVFVLSGDKIIKLEKKYKEIIESYFEIQKRKCFEEFSAQPKRRQLSLPLSIFRPLI